MDGNRLVLLARLHQMGRRAGNHAKQRFRSQDGHFAAEQHARVDAADWREAQEAAVQHLGDDKTDLIKMRVEQYGFGSRLRGDKDTGHGAEGVDIHFG